MAEATMRLCTMFDNGSTDLEWIHVVVLCARMHARKMQRLQEL
jgi:hypothetical protein